jgi:hypothetical protein
LTIFQSNRRSKKKKLSLLLTLSASTVSLLAVTCFAQFLWLLLSAPFCWSSKGVGNFSALNAISTAVLSLLGMQVLTYLGANDAIICVIRHLFFSVSCSWIAFSQHTWQLFNWIYSRTTGTHRTFTFFIAAGLAVVPLVLNM